MIASMLTTVSHPLLSHSLTILRNKETGTEEFRRHAGIVSKILVLEATKTLATTGSKIVTPLAAFAGAKLKEEVIVVPVLRAGLAMLTSVQDVLPSAAVGFMGLERNEQTAIAREYYRKLPKIFSSHLVMVIDPMLATGGSFDDTITALKAKGAKRLLAVCIVAAPEGIRRLTKAHPDVRIVTGAVDEKLNSKAYIVPGLGDFGDRYFGTTDVVL